VDERNREAGNSCGPTARTRSVAARGAPLRYVAELIGGDADSEWGHQVADRAHGDTFTMSWTEREGPPVSPPERRGFGTIVMEAMAERSVDGKVDLDYAPSGLTWRLTCPAANALGPREREQASGEGENGTLQVLTPPLSVANPPVR
jgi:two-component sensor histidine kinase